MTQDQIEIKRTFPILAEDKELESIIKIHKRVEVLIEEKHYTRGDYRLLDAMYLSKYHSISYCRYKDGQFIPLTFEEIRQLPSFETINRSFRLHQAEGKRPLAKTQEKRRIRQYKLRRWLGYNEKKLL